MQKMILATLAVAVLMTPSFGQKADDFATIKAGIEHYKKDSLVTEYILKTYDSPAIKNCREKDWPNTEICRNVALGMIRTLTAYFDYKLPTVPRPVFHPNGK